MHSIVLNHVSLMKKNDNYENQRFQSGVDIKKTETEGYPLYPENEDIYFKFKKEISLDPENITRFKEQEVFGKVNEKDFSDDETGNDLDIPGLEDDDGEEVIGIEDEENNYFSLGGDDHMDLEENQGY